MSKPTPGEVEHALAVLESAGFTVQQDRQWGALEGGLLVMAYGPGPSAGYYVRRSAQEPWTAEP